MPDNRRYITLNGQPPLGGLSPNVAAALTQRARESPPPYTPAPAAGRQPQPQGPQPTIIYVPRPIVGTIPSWQPWTTLPTISISGHIAIPTTSTPAEPPSLPVAQAQSSPALPPGGNAPGTTNNPLVLTSGLGYIFPTTHTTIHLIQPDFFPFAHPPTSFRWRAYKVPTTLTVSELIEQICVVNCPAGKTAVAKGVIECIETGDGGWVRGAEFWVGKGKGEEEVMKGKVKQSLGKVGWDEKRGGVAKPVWVASLVKYA